MEDILIAIDPSLSCTGIAIFDTNSDTYPPKLTSVYSIDTKGLKDVSRSGKLSFIAERFRQIRVMCKPHVVVYESGFSRFVKSTQALYQVQGVMLVAFDGINHFSYAPSSVKKTICGKGNVKKELVRDQIVKMYPETVFSNMDETDAVAVGVHYIKSIEEENE